MPIPQFRQLGELSRHRFRNLPIRHKLTVIATTASIAALLLALGATGVYEYSIARRELERGLSERTTILGFNGSAALAFRDEDAAMELVSALRADNSVISASLIDMNQSVLATYQRDATVDSLQTIDPRRTQIVSGDSWLESLTPVWAGSQRVGTAIIRYDLRPFQRRMASFWTMSAVLVGVTSLVVSALVTVFARLIVRPLSALTKVSRIVTHEHRYSVRVEPVGSDEIGELTRAFNLMLAQVEQRDVALRRARTNLEGLVEERTRELLEAEDAAEHASKVKTEFLPNVSHELRTPLHAILSFATFGLQKYERAPRKKLGDYFSVICESGNRLLSLVNNLLDLSKLHAGRMVFNYEPTSLQEIIDSGITELTALATNKKIVVKKADTPEVTIDGDSARLRQVILNVLGNAIKFSPAGGTVIVGARRTNDEAIVTVEDEGVGIPETELEAIFEKFTQSGKTQTGAGGTGLGLAICREIIHGHSGRIWAENRETGGAKISFALPIRNATSTSTMGLVPMAKGETV